jgi:hypothetical protein
LRDILRLSSFAPQLSKYRLRSWANHPQSMGFFYHHGIPLPRLEPLIVLSLVDGIVLLPSFRVTH